MQEPADWTGLAVSLREHFDALRRADKPHVDLQEYIEGLFREKERALDMAASERDRAAAVLREEQQRALLVAESEREKSAAALRAGTEGKIAENYIRLHDQIKATERLLTALVDAKTTEFQSVHRAAQLAISKAEDANEKRFSAANEWRGQSADRERTQAEAMAKLAATFARSDTVDAQIVGLRDSLEAQLSELRRMIVALTDKISQVV